MPQTPSDHIEQRATLLDAWVEKRRQIARLEAESAELLVDRLLLRDADTRESPYHRDTIHRSMIAEYSAAARVSQGSVEYAFSDAAFLDSDHPAARESFRRGAITGAHVREIVRAGTIVREAVREGRADAGALDLYDAAAVVVAENETPARTRALVRQIAAALAGETLVDRHRRASSERNVTMRSVDDGLALISIVLPEHLAAAIMDRLTQLARQVIAARDDVEPVLSPDGLDSGENPIFPEDLDWSAPGLDEWAIFGERDTFTTDPLPEPSPIIVPADTRTMDQVRTDLLTDLLLAADPSEAAGAGIDQVRAHIQVTVAATTLLGADDRPAELDGFGPIDPDIARDLAGRNGGWSRLFLDPAGMVVETDTYSPTEGMRRFLRARDQHCRFPGCRMPVRRCQIDHNHDHARGGRTSLSNLSHFCAGHHVLKHPDVDEHHRWTARQLPDRSLDWVSPLGRHYSDPPPRRVMFV
ncbi:HNH endonuclease signature motif containing protein [Microbacterium saperdae]|uniref:Uncharacterized protein DUF222 n=1 Tax=Microbacterium saperdae TaxID=69368 RepID=A0A543BI37_9MICO|nr:HNH endonuclease signature motif containing protein [Microbacterium saperdae]TQL84461.1 uncharacterized protein DUF222 [Microbacterium saperdae]GGM60487.1 hypothetical protein GCM10010489_35030 [Microbacterium saperdae]